jgi:glucoamylase
MYLHVFFFVYTLQGFLGYVQAKASTNIPKQIGLDGFIAAETPVALQGILDNIGPNGTNAWGASDGIVIASPSKSDPDCKSHPWLAEQ